MKMTHVLAKTGLALAISAMATGAFAAGTHTVTPASGIVLANEIFGAGSQDTLVAIPENVYTLDTASNTITANKAATVKYTLNNGAVFGEDLSDIAKWAASNATLQFTFTTLNGGSPVAVRIAAGGVATVVDAVTSTAVPGIAIVVDQGGAIGDNTVTFKITANVPAPDSLLNVKTGQVRVKNLTDALKRDGGLGPVSLGAEFRTTDASNVEITDTAKAVEVLRSQNGVELLGTQTGYTATLGGRARINVANTEQQFTAAVGPAASNDFTPSTNSFLSLGTVKIVRTKYDNATGQPATTGTVVSKENGGLFDFQGSDVIKLTLTSTQSLASYGSIFLRPAGTPCSHIPSALTGTVSGNDAVITLSGETTTKLETGYNVCATPSGSAAIPESSFSASLLVNYFNPRYIDSDDTLEYGNVLRNGCQVTLFNLPNVNATDKGMIRLTNVSDNPGSVRAFVWTETGEKIDVDSVLTETLGAHATTVFHTNANLASGVYLGDVLPEFAALKNGRHRLVLQGAFPACEALGLVRSPEGTLTNMTSTTYSGSNTFLGTDQSNTSNTSN